MKLRLEATPAELWQKGTALLEQLAEAFSGFNPDLANRLEKALPPKEHELKYPVLRDLRAITTKEYEATLKRMLAEVGKVLDRSVTAPNAVSTELTKAEKLTKQEEKDPGAEEEEKLEPGDVDPETGDLIPEEEEEGEEEEPEEGEEKSLEKGGPFIGPKGGKWEDAAHTIPWKEKKVTPARVLLEQKVGHDKAVMYLEMAPTADPESWRAWMAKVGLSTAQADEIRGGLISKEKKERQQRAREEVAASEKAAFQGIDLAAGIISADLSGGTPDGFSIESGLESVGKMLGGLRDKYPQAAKLVSDLKGVRSSNRGKSGHAANYRDGYIEINDLSQISPGVLLHELGHMLEDRLPAGWSSGKGWNMNDPSASTYAAQKGHSEQLAEAFVVLVGGNAEAFTAHAPEQARLVTELMNGQGTITKALPQSEPLQHDFTKPIADKDDRAYARVKRVLIGRGYVESDFKEGGPLYGYSVNQLIDLVREARKAVQ